MRVIGIDPGYAIVGYGIVDYSNNSFKTVCYGAIRTEAGIPFDQRLLKISDNLEKLFKRFNPDSMSIEKLFFTSNQKTVIDVSQARGVIVVTAAKYGIPVFEYTPLQVKQSVVGYGRAEKRQVMEMTKMMLGLKTIPKPDDAADALAVAICHSHTSSSLITDIRS
ncbi:MAG: crossover junction endodeoxyribonuclease RuvC [Ruminococcaceae bacterium]|nr:crossover junction endodeoxyribonuclease RuvC [Oscillospiraceae bacterium]